MPVFNNVLAGAAGQGGAADYIIERSLRLNSSDQSKLTRTPSAQGSTKTWTLSWWMKAPEIDSTIFAAGNGNTPGRFSFGTNGNGAFFAAVVDNNSSVFSITTDAFFRDPSAWYHCCLVCDSTAATQADRFKIIVNGVRQTVTGTLMPQNQNTFVNTTQKHQWSGRSYLDIDFADGYLADIQFVDGQAIDPDGNFGGFDATTGVWNPIAFTGTYNFTPTVTYPAVYVTSPGTYGAVTDVNTVNGSVFSSAGSTGAGSIKVEFASAITGVTHVKFKGGGYSANAGFSIKVNGSTTHSGLTTNSSYTVRTETLSSATDITSFEIVSGSDGWALGDLQFSTDGTNFTAPSGTAAVIPSAGVNGFYLDFSDNSSNAALGFDANVSGTRYSADWSGTLASNYTFATLFDGNVSTLCLGANGATLTWTPASPIAWTDSAGGVEIYYHNTSSPDKARVNGGSWVNQANNSGGWEKVSSGDGTLTKLEVRDQVSSEAAIYAIRVNGTILTDPSGANDWTVNNFTAVLSTPPFSWDGGTLNLSATGGSGNAGGYKDAYFLLPSSGSHSWDMVINTDGNTGFWFSDTSSASNTHPNQQSGNFVGLRNNGGGSAATGGSGFGSGSVSMPSDAMDGDPRWYFTIDRDNGSGTVKAGASGSSYNFTIPTTGNVYFHVNAYGAYEFDLSSGSPSDIDSLIDSPTNYDDGTNIGGNYATWNPLATNSNTTVSNGNLDVTSAQVYTTLSTIGFPSSGKFYGEFTVSNISAGYPFVGIGAFNDTGIRSNANPNTGAFYAQGGYITGGVSVSSLGSLSAGDIVGVAYDASTRQAWFSVNGTYVNSGNPATGANPTCTLPVNDSGYGWAVSTYQHKVSLNAGQRAFYTAPPSGFVSLCTQNLDDPLIADPSTVFDTVLYTGDGQTTQTVALPFEPGLLWQKKRSGVSSHYLFDAIRGFNNTKAIGTHTAAAEGNNSAYYSLSASGSNLTLGDVGAGNEWNINNQTHAIWTWDAGSSNTSISAGGLNSSVYDQSTTWSSLMSGHYQNAASAFDANGTTYAEANSGATIEIDLSNNSITATSRLQVLNDPGFTGSTDVQYKIYTTSSSTPAFSKTIGGTQSFDEASSNWSSAAITKITVRGLNEGARISKVIYDGKTLVNDTTTPPNVPTIASTTRANQTAGFSIVNASVAASLTGGPTIAHGLNKKPEFILGKNRDYGIYWYAYHKDLNENHYLIPHLTNAQTNSSAVWGSHSSLDSNVFQIGSGSPASMWIPSGTDDCIFYAWTSVENYSAFGSYEGNGSLDGPFVALSFKPALIWIKNIDNYGSGYDWFIFDTTRDTFNVAENVLKVNLSDAEYDSDSIDILSNGFKIRTTTNGINLNNHTHVWAAFAENPFKYARAA